MPSDNIIRFPGAEAKRGTPTPAAASAPAQAAARIDGVPGPDGITEEQRKAVGIILGGLPFICIGIKPTDDGADFFTACGGDAADLRNAAPHLDGVLARLLSKRDLL